MEAVLWVLEVLEVLVALVALVDHRAMTRVPRSHVRTVLVDQTITTRTKDRASNLVTMVHHTLEEMDQAALIREASEVEEAWVTLVELDVVAVGLEWAAAKATLTNGMHQPLEVEEGDSKEVVDLTKARTLKPRASQDSQDPVNL